MREAFLIFRRDLKRCRWTLVLFLLMLAGEVAAYCSPQSSNPEAESLWVILAIWALSTWLVQFLLVTQLIHGDAPSRIVAQWRTRPFRPADLAMAKVGGILLWVFLPPWVGAQAARLAFGLQPGIGAHEGPLYHLALVSGFCLVAVVTTSTARAFLTALGALVTFGFAVALIGPVLGTSIARMEQPLIPADVALALALISLALGALVNGYRKGGLPSGLLLIAWVCCLWFVLRGGPSPRLPQEPEIAEVTEQFRAVASWGTGRWDDKKGWYASLRHVRTKPRRVVVETDFSFSTIHDGGSSVGWWPVIVPADGPARIDGLGDVEFVPSVDLWDRRHQFGPFDPGNPDSMDRLEFDDVSYTVRTYELLGRLRFGETPARSTPTWNMRSVENPRRVEMRTLEPSARAATFDPATKRLQATNATPGSLGILWPIGADVSLMWIRNDAKAECVLLRETIVGKGAVYYSTLPMDIPSDWRSKQETK